MSGMRGDVTSPGAFWQGWSPFMQDERFSMVAEPEGFRHFPKP
jgi:hypothetical protein